METPGARDGIGDTSLGITSLLALAWQRSRDPRLVEPVRSSLGFHLRERVFRYDNPGYPNLRIRDSGEPYARYALGDGEHPIGDVTGGLMLTRRLLPEAAGTVRETTVCRYAEELRARRLPDRGGLLPVEHGGAYDNNYGPISLSFLAQAHRVRDTAASGLVAKLVTKPVVTRDHGLPHTQSLYVTDGTRLWLTVTLGRAEGEPYLPAGLPYVAEADGGHRKIAEIGGVDLAEKGARRTTDGSVVAAGLAVTAAGALSVTTPDYPGDDGSAYFNSADTIGLTQEQAAFRPAADPRGYGNPDEGWRHIAATTALDAAPCPAPPDGLTVFALRYGPAHAAAERFAPRFTRTGSGLTVATEAFTAHLGPPAGGRGR